NVDCESDVSAVIGVSACTSHPLVKAKSDITGGATGTARHIQQPAVEREERGAERKRERKSRSSRSACHSAE
ncbi:hypothetical protein JZ751_017534, partial [Albula glossodonta]